GTSIATLIRKTEHIGAAAIEYRDFDEARAEERRKALLDALQQGGSYRVVEPIIDLGLPFKPMSVAPDYLTWPILPDLFPVAFPGVKTSRDSLLVDVDRERLVERMQAYFDANIGDEEMRRICEQAMERTTRFDAINVRRRLQQRGM